MCRYFGQEVPEDFKDCPGCTIARECEDVYEHPTAHPFGCVCDDYECQDCEPGDPDALDFARLIALGMSPQEAAEVKDFEYFDFEEWQRANIYA